MPKFLFQLVPIAAMIVILSSCNGSKVGQWTENDKARFRAEMQSVPELSVFGNKQNEFIECYLEKCEAKYASFDAANQDESGCESLAFECGETALSSGSEKGAWSDNDKQLFRDQMNTVQELEALGDKKQSFIECYLEKCELNYSSFVDANQDEAGCEALALECTTEVSE